MKVLQELKRHSDIRTTMNVYGKAMDESKRTAHGKVNLPRFRAQSNEWAYPWSESELIPPNRVLSRHRAPTKQPS
jgi:hypothetical protein